MLGFWYFPEKRGSSVQQSPAGNSRPFPWECESQPEDGRKLKISEEGAKRESGSTFGFSSGFQIIPERGGDQDPSWNVGSSRSIPIKLHVFIQNPSDLQGNGRQERLSSVPNVPWMSSPLFPQLHQDLKIPKSHPELGALRELGLYLIN